MISTILIILALVLSPVIGGGFGELTNGILQIIVFAGAICYMLMPKKNTLTWTKTPGFVAIVVFLGLMLISSCLSQAYFASTKQFLFMLASFISYILASTLFKDNKYARAAVLAFSVSAFAIAALGIRDYAISTGGGAEFWKALQAPGDHWRLFGTFANPSFFSGFLVLSIPVTIAIYLVARGLVNSVLVCIGLLFQICALFFTGTKFGLYSVIIAIVIMYLLILITRKFSKDVLVKSLVIIILVLPVFKFMSAPVTSRIQEAGQGGTQVHSANFRVFTWKATINMIKANPVLGTGPGTFDTAFPKYAIAGITKHAHQGYLQIAAENGVPSLIAYLAALLSLAVFSLRGIKAFTLNESVKVDNTKNDITLDNIIPQSGWCIICYGIIAALIGSCVRNMVDPDCFVIGISLPFWILAGVLISQMQVEQRQLKNNTIIYVSSICFAVFCVISLFTGLGDYYMSKTSSKDPVADMEYIKLASKVSPLNPVYHRELGKMYSAIPGEFEKSNTEFNTAIRLAPKDGTNYFTYAMVLLRNSDYGSAIKNFKKALMYNPHSTQTLTNLADTYLKSGDNIQYESTLKLLLGLENTPSEQVKGVPEMVDVSYAFAHVYFGKQYIDKADYKNAIKDYDAAAQRLERWRSQKQYIEIAMSIGKLNSEEKLKRLEILHDCYINLSKAYTKIGDTSKAREAESKAKDVDEAINEMPY